jgi:cytochrome c oxidase assembly protein subunit 15
MNATALIHRDRRSIVLWLGFCLLLVAAMVLVGGYTRLSGSGLSITEWKPIHGVLPPLNDVQWAEEFDAYRASPQYIKINSGMNIEQFKTIFWPEFFHRLLGRAVGIVFFVPLIIFAMRRSISKYFGWRMVAIFALGGLQGIIGWLMVKSGLVDTPRVSHLRLALHLAMAFALFGLILWAILNISSFPRRRESQLSASKNLDKIPAFAGMTIIFWFILLGCQIIMGAFVAGLHGGLIFNTWPDMNGQFLPQELWAPGPWYENIALIQFIHRTLAVILAAGFILWWYCIRNYVKNKHLGKVCAAVAVVLGLQFALGVMTLLHQAPLHLAWAHQMTALLLFASSVTLLYKITHD